MFPSPVYLPNPGIKPRSPGLQANCLPAKPPGKPTNDFIHYHFHVVIICDTLKVLVPQLCLTLCDPMDCSPPGSSVHGILQTRILEWVAISFSQGIFPTQGSNLDRPHCRHILYHLSHQGSPLNYNLLNFSIVNNLSSY